MPSGKRNFGVENKQFAAAHRNGHVHASSLPGQHIAERNQTLRSSFVDGEAAKVVPPPEKNKLLVGTKLPANDFANPTRMLLAKTTECSGL